MSLKSFTSERSAEELHTLIDTVPDAMVISDEDANIVAFSTGSEQMFGYCEADVVGESVYLLMQSPDREGHDWCIDRSKKTGEARVVGTDRVTTARHRDGSTFPIRLSIGVLDFGEQRGFVAYIRDLTESHQTERELHKLQSELAHVSRISSMGSLATSLAHELNQPLTAVANYAHSARDLLSDPTPETIELVREALDECAAEALRAGQIVHRLRDFIKRGETERQIASLRRIIQEASALALMNGDGKGVDFETEIDREADEVIVDPVQIQQVMHNLIRNALEAMLESRHRQLRVRTQKTSDGFAMVSVMDSGPGLDQTVAERLFHPFNGTKQNGMGIGLSICHSIVQSHNGKIWAEPSALGGTAFHFTVPLAETGNDE
ncbi:MAG: PAS domain S-box protein [Erythrobacter sp.]|uniref:PAS domain-containing sensor histidine kinase n=1 Tax=Erythrobacter sp. TaxID=1042 RepID=UPI002619CE45|nr:PAS domain-containing sensor histidine kinase [Erythrobacter sp.]MDJ0977550.1 PAS domain S-box protein [Erythrobacter sp.]